MSEQNVLFEISEQVAVLTLNRPAVLNSINATLAQELIVHLWQINSDSPVRAVLITGSGRGFCAGQDLSEISLDGDLSVQVHDIVRLRCNEIVRCLRKLHVPVVCAVNGVAAGAGASLALCADLVIAADTASFVQSFSKIGLIPDTGATYVLPRLVGLARARELFMLGQKVSAQAAYEMGMISRVVPAANLMTEAKALAVQLAQQPTQALGLIRQALDSTFEHTLEEQLKLEEDLQKSAAGTADFAEGVKAFFEKRSPVFTGR